MGLVRAFAQISKQDTAIAGGKGASLGEMTQAGISVPPGFVILSEAFEEALLAQHHEIDAIIRKLHPDDLSAMEHASVHIRKLILDTPMPSHIAHEIMQHFDQLDTTYVAIRSSATAEDGATAAWAGQLDSYLNRTREALIDGVQHCWASLFTPRAIFYRLEQKATQRISVAVVIQKMVESEVAGVAFSVHPVTQNRNQIFIEGARGLGHAVVSGEVTPDSYLVEKSGKILEKHIGNQKRAYVRSISGNSWKDIGGDEQKLNDEQILELAELITHIEQHYNFPVDVEWALEKGKFYIVQSRPITTLSSKETSASFRREDYLLSFWVRGVSVFVTDIHKDVYAHLGILFIIDNGMFKQYFLKSKYEKALEEGVLFYSDEHAVQAYKTALHEHCENLARFFEHEIKNKTHIEKLALEKFFSHIAKLVGDYTKMNFEYTDKAFALQEHNPIIKNNLALVARFKDEVRSVMNKALFEECSYISTAFAILETQFKLPSGLLNNLTQKEILGIYNGKSININQVMHRQEKFIISHDRDQPYEGSEAESIAREFDEKVTSTEVLTGQCASKGRIKGKVKIIPVDYSNNFERVNREIEKMEQGDILIAETTAPELIVACKKAGAIVTDMGGLMSHAAIVSREFGIPCIVGAQIATKIFKDGDVVEVDASKGTVRKV
jgi:phosphoenolpyruvate synthase/pyruvate phosphate dikinase